MKITLTQDAKGCLVCVLSEDLELDLAVRFHALDDAAEFADLWAEWIGCTDVERTILAPAPALTAAA